MVNNIEIIRNNLKFDKFGEFYYISIIQRSKDGILVKGSHDNSRRIRTFYVYICTFVILLNKIIAFSW